MYVSNKVLKIPCKLRLTTSYYSYLSVLQVSFFCLRNTISLWVGVLCGGLWRLWVPRRASATDKHASVSEEGDRECVRVSVV